MILNFAYQLGIVKYDLIKDWIKEFLAQSKLSATNSDNFGSKFKKVLSEILINPILLEKDRFNWFFEQTLKHLGWQTTHEIQQTHQNVIIKVLCSLYCSLETLLRAIGQNTIISRVEICEDEKRFLRYCRCSIRWSVIVLTIIGGIFAISEEKLICVHLSGVYIFPSTLCLFIFVFFIGKGDPKFVEKRGNSSTEISILYSSFGGVKIDDSPENCDDVKIERAT